ncbi:MAG: RDD family protein [Synechococcales bacterium]|nr:RDD family protein [Synechococcales bacterium]
MKYFNRITLRTPESVELEFLLPGIGSRVFAYVIDYTILMVSMALVFIFGSLFFAQLLEYLDRIGMNTEPIVQWIGAIALLALFALYVGYFVIFETMWKGSTPGKRWAKIRVIREDGRPIALNHATMRALLRPIDDLFFIGFFLILLGQREKRLGDWVAGTIVVQEELPPVGSSSFPLSGQAQDVADSLLQNCDLSHLLPDDFAIVREYLQRRSRMETKVRSDTSLNLARQVRERLRLEKLPFEMTSDVFLEGVYLAYQQQN